MICLLLVLLCVPGVSAAAGSDDEVVRIGVLAKRGPRLCLDMWSPTARYLSGAIHGKTFVIVPTDFEHIYDYVEKGKVDFVLANSSFYVELEEWYDVDRIATLRNRRLEGVYTKFGGVIFCRAHRDDIKTLRDLKGKTFMAVKE
ncbi:MAG: PhnD/SsuA/transferrin family substrate-binding protein, partial [Deltaproteobacteria bacterium]|nr:PhnD/SsuA/transferrin family substrate-binding protein [Deltaproteobacteria bacterium]